MRTVALIIAIVLGIAAAIGVKTVIDRRTSEAQERTRLVAVATAKQRLSAGMELDEDMLLFSQMRKPLDTLAPQDITPTNVGRFLGHELKRNVDQGAQVTIDDLAPRQEMPFSERLKSGVVAVSIGVDAGSAVSYLIEPEDHVDIYATTVREREPETRLVLSQVMVRAVDNRTTRVPMGVDSYRSRGRGYSNVTLLVTPEEAKLLIFLRSNAQLTFALSPAAQLGRPTNPGQPIGPENWRAVAEQANAERQRALREEAGDDDTEAP